MQIQNFPAVRTLFLSYWFLSLQESLSNRSFCSYQLLLLGDGASSQRSCHLLLCSGHMGVMGRQLSLCTLELPSLCAPKDLLRGQGEELCKLSGRAAVAHFGFLVLSFTGFSLIWSPLLVLITNPSIISRCHFANTLSSEIGPKSLNIGLH